MPGACAALGAGNQVAMRLVAVGSPGIFRTISASSIRASESRFSLWRRVAIETTIWIRARSVVR